LGSQTGASRKRREKNMTRPASTILPTIGLERHRKRNPGEKTGKLRSEQGKRKKRPYEALKLRVGNVSSKGIDRDWRATAIARVP